MSSFLANNREELIVRCKLKVSQRLGRGASDKQLSHGVPLFLDQLTRTLKAEQQDDQQESLAISGPSGGDKLALSELGVSATTHGRELLLLGYSVDQVVHDYGDLCQAITDLAFERDAPFQVGEFRTLNRCLDNAIADAVTEFSFHRDSLVAHRHSTELNARLGFLVHELRNSLNTASLACSALAMGNMTMSGATGGVLKRSLAALTDLLDRAIVDVRLSPEPAVVPRTFSLAHFIGEAQVAAELEAAARGCTLAVTPVHPLLWVKANRELMLAALANLLHNAFKFTHPGSEVTLSAYSESGRIVIDVRDQCGGLPPGSTEAMFTPFLQRNEDRSGLGLGLTIARQSVEANNGTLTVKDLPGQGCVFTINLMRHAQPVAGSPPPG
ncbi:MAG: HAMP domain-containing histidine kinase [Comamonadaceae bacterium]|nr:MAG: HAMP domain-containing histidine kinase [Comamonadaceae bacterium]